MKLTRRLAIPFALAGAQLANPAMAGDAITIRGYGNLGFSKLVRIKEGTGRFEKYDGLTKKGSFTRDSRFGLNLQAPITDNITAMLQVNAELATAMSGESKNSILETRIAGFRWQPIENLTLLVGQQVVPLWMISEEKVVGFTYPWIRPPNEVYWMDMESMVGARAFYNINIGNFVLRPGFTYGDLVYNYKFYSFNNSGNNGGALEAPFRATLGILELDSDNISLRGVYAGAFGNYKLYYRSDREDTQAPQTKSDGIIGPVMKNYIEGNQLAGGEMTGRFGSVAAKANVMDIFASGEWAYRSFKYGSVVGGVGPLLKNAQQVDKAWQATLGYNIGKFSPRVTYSSWQGRMRINKSSLEESVVKFDLHKRALAMNLLDARVQSTSAAQLRGGLSINPMNAADIKETDVQGVITKVNAALKSNNPIAKAGATAGVEAAKTNTVNSIKNSVERSPSQNTLTLGVNYQWNDQMVVKAEWFRTLANEQNTNTTGPMLARGARIQGINLGVNFVF